MDDPHEFIADIIENNVSVFPNCYNPPRWLPLKKEVQIKKSSSF
jgi:hypothetical protein